ncbi:MAG: hypothetical protein JST64_08125 [Actinobacteria bacterium]|nr:hypothetical protein [Actinomycetota bacterium]
MSDTDLDAARANAHAIAYRLIGDRAATRAVVDTSMERLRASGALDRPDWLCALAAETVAGSVGVLGTALTTGPAATASAASTSATTGPGCGASSPGPTDADPEAPRRTELRSRLAAASRDERIAAALHHLAGYPIETVATFMGRSPEEVARLADVVRPPQGTSYRFLGDPNLVGPPPAARRSPPRISRSTVASIVVVIGLVLGASRCVGERPTLRSAGAPVPVAVGPDVASRPSPGCGVAGGPPGVSETTAPAAHAPVPYRLAVPPPSAPASSPGSPDPRQPASTQPRALLVAVGDAGTGAAAFADGPGPERAGTATGWVVATTGDTGTAAEVAAVIRHVGDHVCIDESRIAVTGLGTGAQTATLLACSNPELVAVAAPVAGASMPAGCRLSPSVSLLVQWNADDAVMPATGGYGSAPLSSGSASRPRADAASMVARSWARAIDAGPLSRHVEPDGTAIEQATSGEGATVRSVVAPTGGHTWSPATSAAVLDFAAAHARAPA